MAFSTLQANNRIIKDYFGKDGFEEESGGASDRQRDRDTIGISLEGHKTS
jgi:hypothetical protein